MRHGIRAPASGRTKKMPCTGRASDAGPSDCRSISRNHDDCDDNDGRDQRERTIKCFRAAPCGGRFERRHDLTSLSSATFEACLVLQRSIPDGQPFYGAGRFFSAPRFAARRAASRALPQGRPPLSHFDCVDRRFRFPVSRPCCFSPVLLLAHVLLGRLEFAAKPAANVGFRRILRCSRGLDTTALLALKCPAVAARGSALDPREKHSRVIADRAARPLDRGEVGWADRLIFRHGTSPRREGYEVTDDYRDRAAINQPCRYGDLTRWSILLIFQY
jgi:hypothetical protein